MDYGVVKRDVVEVKKLIILLILFVFVAPAYAATIYKWVDKEGVANYSDDYSKVPALYRDRVQALEFLTETGPSVQTPKTTPGSKEEIRTDIYGRDETWWREKVHPWKEELKEATENYENAQKEYMEQAEGLGEFKFGRLSLTQYQMLSYRLEVLNKEMETCQGQIAEANEMLSRLFQEAKETKADPAWLE
jgi:hypothetical protein